MIIEREKRRWRRETYESKTAMRMMRDETTTVKQRATGS